MTLTWTIFGVIFQLGLGVFLAMIYIFIGGAVANSCKLSKGNERLLTSGIYLIPLVSVVVSLLISYSYILGMAADYYWLHLITLIVFATLFILAKKINKNGAGK